MKEKNRIELKLKKSNHGLNCIELENTSIEVMNIMKRIVTNQYSISEDYHYAKNAGCFLQGFEPKYGWILIEFWSSNMDNIFEFINYLSQKLEEEEL